jgi:hypothetical protein
MRKRPMTDEELDAYIDELNEREAAQIKIDESILVIEVRGRIGNVRWLETEFGARKQRYSQRRYNNYVEYTEYVVEMPAEDQRTTSLLRRLQSEQEDGAGIWFETGPKVN